MCFDKKGSLPFCQSPLFEQFVIKHVFHTGGRYESYLQIPVIPPKYDDDTVFVVDETAHPTHPIF